MSPELGGSSTAVELIMAAMAAMATKEVLAYRIKAKELLHKPRGPTPLYLDATAVLHGTATEQVSRKIRHLAAKLVIAQDTRAHEKVRAVEIDVSLHPATSPPSLCREGEFVYERARIPGLEGGVSPPPKAQPGYGTERAWRPRPRSPQDWPSSQVTLPKRERRRQPARAWRRDTSSWRSGPPPGPGTWRPGEPGGAVQSYGAVRWREQD